MKSILKFQLGFSLHGKHVVPPSHGILLRLMSPFLRDQVETLILLVVKLS
jgi:hypothetical protein